MKRNSHRSQTTPERPPFAERVRAGLQEALEWTQGARRLRGSEKVDGEWVGAEDTGMGVPRFASGSENQPSGHE